MKENTYESDDDFDRDGLYAKVIKDNDLKGLSTEEKTSIETIVY